MRVFVTGATGFIGSRVVSQLLKAGHTVLGMARSDAGAASLSALGADIHRGDVTDLDCLRHGVESSDSTIHLAFIHDFSRFQESCEIDRRAVEAMGDALAGTPKLLLVTSGTGITSTTPGVPATEDAPPVSSQVFPRAATEEAVRAVESRGARVAVVRLPQVHDTRKQGFVTPMIQIARAKGVVAYLGEGLNRWPAGHVLDVARLYRLALEKNEAGARYNAVAEEGVQVRDIAEAIGRGLKIPAVSLSPKETPAHFGWFAQFIQWDIPASSTVTRQKLNWNPTGPGLIADLDNMDYSIA